MYYREKKYSSIIHHWYKQPSNKIWIADLTSLIAKFIDPYQRYHLKLVEFNPNRSVKDQNGLICHVEQSLAQNSLQIGLNSLVVLVSIL